MELQAGAVIGGTIYGNEGTDTLSFNFVVPADEYEALAALVAQNASSGEIMLNGITYRWNGFEDLVMLLQEVAQEAEAAWEAEQSGGTRIIERLNYMDIAAPVAVYCGEWGMVKAVFASGQEWFNLSFVDALLAVQAEPVQVGDGLWALPNNQLAVSAPEANDPTKTYTFVFDAAACLN